MLIGNLFEEILIKPAQQGGADELQVISGFATPNMVYEHMHKLWDENCAIPISLTIGMTPISGLNKAQHQQFQKLASNSTKIAKPDASATIYPKPFNCRYITKGHTPSHAKVFIWLKNKTPLAAYAGSANYTKTGFSKNQIETMSEVDPQKAKHLFDAQRQNSMDCANRKIQQEIEVIDKPMFPTIQHTKKAIKQATPPLSSFLPHVKLPLVKRNGQTQSRAGLNWGQRGSRNPNQAYIPIPKEIQKQKFFPHRGDYFVMQTDDGRSFIMVVAQDNSKALHTPEDNALIGEYFRTRLGVASGGFVERLHLDAYGRHDVDVYRIDAETYYMDFSP